MSRKLLVTIIPHFCTWHS